MFQSPKLPASHFTVRTISPQGFASVASPRSTPYKSPPTHQARPSSASTCVYTSRSSRETETFRSRAALHQSPALIGFVTSESANYFIVKQKSVWIPVAKTAFYSARGERLASLRIQDIRMKKVRVFKATTNTPEAYFVNEGEELGHIETEIDIGSDGGLWEEDTMKAAETQMSLSTELLTDVAVLANLASDRHRSMRYLRQRATKLRRSMDYAFHALRSASPEYCARTSPTYLQLVANMDLLASDSPQACHECSEAAATVTLTCGHHFCVDCAHGLVDPRQCPLCGRELSLTDCRLILLEKYEELKKAMSQTDMQ